MCIRFSGSVVIIIIIIVIVIIIIIIIIIIMLQYHFEIPISAVKYISPTVFKTK
jgi:hypothetical protein